MDDWRKALTDQLLAPTSQRAPISGIESVTALEVVLGQARSEMTYVLELGRAHTLPVTGSVNGDDIWLRVGATTLRFNYSRRAGVIVASVVGREDQQLRWSPEKRVVILPSGETLDAPTFVREAIDATVNAWRSSGRPDVAISMLKSDRPPAPTLPDSSEILPKS
jgi:hypothetical protein